MSQALSIELLNTHEAIIVPTLAILDAANSVPAIEKIVKHFTISFAYTTHRGVVRCHTTFEGFDSPSDWCG